MTDVRAEMTASVWKVVVDVGQVVAQGADLIILESMKMEIPVEAPSPGTVVAIHVVTGDQVDEGTVLVTMTT